MMKMLLLKRRVYIRLSSFDRVPGYLCLIYYLLRSANQESPNTRHRLVHKSVPSPVIKTSSAPGLSSYGQKRVSQSNQSITSQQLLPARFAALLNEALDLLRPRASGNQQGIGHVDNDEIVHTEHGH